MKILSKQDFNKNESENFVVDNSSEAPQNPVDGQIYYNTLENRAYIYKNNSWRNITSDYVYGQNGNYMYLKYNPNPSYNPINLSIDGKAEQNGTPTPEIPAEIEVITGNVEVKNNGKNYFDKSQYTRNWNTSSNTITELDTGLRITCIQNGVYRYSIIPLPDSNKLLGKTINVSAMAALYGSGSSSMNMYFINETNHTLISSFGSKGTTISGEISFSITVPTSYPTNATGIALLLYSGSFTQTLNGHYVDYTDILIEEGTIKSNYKPYHLANVIYSLGTEFMAKIDEATDYIKNGVLYKNVGRFVFNGSENWTKQSTANGYRFRYLDNSIKLNSGVNGIPKIISNYFPTITPFQTWVSITGITTPQDQSGIFICYENSTVDTLEKFKNWLYEHNLIVYYALATPYAVGLTTNKLQLYEGVNNITNNFDTNMSIEYFADIKDNDVIINTTEPEVDDAQLWINPNNTIYKNSYDALPVGSIIDYDGTIVPEGYIKISESDSIMKIQKAYGTVTLTGDVIDSLDGNSTYNAPSINAVNEAFNNRGITSLWDGNQNSGNVPLSDSYKNYDIIIITIRASSGASGTGTVSLISSITNLNQEIEISCFQSTGVYVAVSGFFSSETIFHIESLHQAAWSSASLMNISGIKF